MSDNALFDRVVAASGLNELVAPFTISRLLLRADVQPRAVTPDDLERALPELESGLRVYLDESAVSQAVTRMRELTR